MPETLFLEQHINVINTVTFQSQMPLQDCKKINFRFQVGHVLFLRFRSGTNECGAIEFTLAA